MFEAGLSNLLAFCSKRTFPVSSEATLMPIVADASCGRRRISEMRACNSPSVRVVDAVGRCWTGGGTVKFEPENQKPHRELGWDLVMRRARLFVRVVAVAAPNQSGQAAQ